MSRILKGDEVEIQESHYTDTFTKKFIGKKGVSVDKQRLGFHEISIDEKESITFHKSELKKIA